MQTNTLEYKHNDTLLEGFYAYDDSTATPRPAVIIVHDWSGRNEFACNKAKTIAELGYVGFALDMYGKGVRGETKEEKTALITPLMQNRALLQERVTLAQHTIAEQNFVDSNKIAIMGFCFGGLCALDLARTGVDIKGAIAIHALFNPADNLKDQMIKAKILALHGYDDPMVPPEQIDAFADEMTKKGADWQLHIYGNTMHAFTNPQANDPDFGTVYDATADRRSWQTIQNFLAEVF